MNKFKVPIKNVLFMYSYIWDKVGNFDYINLSSEDDFVSSNIYAELFLINIRKILKRGLYKTYITTNDLYFFSFICISPFICILKLYQIIYNLSIVDKIFCYIYNKRNNLLRDDFYVYEKIYKLFIL